MVADTGIGIPRDEIDKIFNKFTQVENGLTSEKGSGLGLAIVRKIIEGHEGKISCESDSGKGTKFTVYLPKRKEETSSQQ